MPACTHTCISTPALHVHSHNNPMQVYNHTYTDTYVHTCVHSLNTSHTYVYFINGASYRGYMQHVFSSHTLHILSSPNINSFRCTRTLSKWYIYMRICMRNLHILHAIHMYPHSLHCLTLHDLTAQYITMQYITLQYSNTACNTHLATCNAPHGICLMQVVLRTV